eukprot:NODE_1045_length_1689_cov_55.343150_g981_i0.p1 GENE.NODE_1045_length_1689_cov_55.343150_g981_i0~~NODE_1045_length_1689_cov_55.343150_g981_i0.p1  ORF type:complete len:409 (+),score=134.52 NODE_1045_length_1689_cov_55.343150_g981_i0:421-1647(+)
MTLLEYKDKSREFATNQSDAGGMGVMDPPRITKDEPITLGCFQHVLEYTQIFPHNEQGPTQFTFMNLLTLHNGLAYVVQYMARTESFQTHLAATEQMVTSMLIDNLPPRKPSRIEYCSATHQLKCEVPETWVVTSESRLESDGRQLVVAFVTGASHHPDVITLYKLDTPFSSAKQLAAQYQALVHQTVPIKMADGIATFTYTDGDSTVAVSCTAGFALEVKPQGSRITVDPHTLCRILQSIHSSSVSTNTIRYINMHGGFAFSLVPHGRLLEHKWGATSLTYTPIPFTDSQEESVPIFTVEVTTEVEKFPSLQAVEAKIMADTDPSARLQHKRVELINAREFLSFEITREESPMGPFGPQEEFRSRILISLRGGEESIMLKWEVSATEWQLYEHHLTALVDSFEVFDH